MSKIKIMCTSTGCIDYAPDRYKSLGIDIIRLHVFFNGKDYREGCDLDPVDFYRQLETIEDPKNHLPSSGMPDTEEIMACFDRAIADGYDEAIVYAISSTLGGTSLKGDNRLIDLSVGDIYGGNYSRFSLGSELIASSFGKVKYTKNVNDVNKKDISRSLVTLFASAVSQMTAFISVSGKIDKIILVGNPFESLVLMQMFQVCTAMFSKNRVHEMFSDYSQYLEIIGMCVELDKTQLVTFDIEDEYKGLI